MAMGLWEALRRNHPDTVRFGGVCYLRLPGGNLAKAELTSGGGYCNGLRLTVLNPRSGPVDSLEIHSWNLPRRAEESIPGCDENAAWDIYRPTPDIEGLAELAEEYLRLFRTFPPELR